MIEITNAASRALRDRAEAAQGRYEEQERMLYRADGQPVYGEAEMGERLRDLRAERTEALRQIQEEARAIGEGARAKAEDGENADPLATLTAGELDRANARRDFAMDAADSLDTDRLLERLGAVLRGGDRAEIAAYLMAGERRRAGIIERRRELAARSGQAPPPSGAPTPLDEALGRLHSTLVGDRSAEVAAARTLEREAVAVEMLAANLAVGERSAAGAWGQRLRPEVA